MSLPEDVQVCSAARKKPALLAIGFVLGSLVLARLWLNSALLWDILSHVPKAVWEGLATAVRAFNSSDVHAQEQLLEFVASWLVALIFLAIVGGIALLAWRLTHGNQTGPRSADKPRALRRTNR